MATGDRRRRKNNIGGGGGGVDSISSLPDELLQQILCFLPTKFAIRTSLLSKRWRRIWCDTPCISFESCALLAASRSMIQDRYTAPKMMSLHLRTGMVCNVKHINSWIELAKSRKVENIYLQLYFKSGYKYIPPDSFYIDSSLKELSLSFTAMIPRGSVSWTSLKKLTLSHCRLSDESLATILSGCPQFTESKNIRSGSPL
ncbi:putative F-box/LRR-repeat protein At3g18150 [Eutrema salsugineum]|uniref:putative F-box/LRR-repeat protein At3g18150 n=1 Tax=Eutrema salsugineum TaxID=72664 RepID=UPI000CED2904|nr:putative F-box/LRR-repeat protein At3g18150 [Eutrema salsugineum]